MVGAPHTAKKPAACYFFGESCLGFVIYCRNLSPVTEDAIDPACANFGAKDPDSAAEGEAKLLSLRVVHFS